MPEHDPFATAPPEAGIPKHHTSPEDSSAPETPELKDEKLNLVFVGVSNRSFRAHAIEEANRRYNAATSGEGFVGVLKALKHGEFKKVPGRAVEAFKQSVKGGIGRDITLGMTLINTSQEITDSQNLKVHEGGQAEDYEHALLYRFNEAADKYEDVIQEAAGEKRIKFNLATLPEDEGPISNAVKTDLRELLTGAVRGDFDSEDGAFNKKAFNEAVKDFEVQTAKNPDAAPYLNSSALRVNNMYQMVLALRARLSTIEAANPNADDETINQLFNGILDQTDVIFGEAHVGSHAETGRSMQERIADKLSRVPFLNPESVAIAAGAVLMVGQIAKRRTLVTAAAAGTIAAGGAPLVATMAAVGLTGAALGGLRGASAARQEHILRARRHARGEHDPLEGVGLYEGKTFTEVTDELDLLYDEHGELRQDNLNVTMQIYAQAAARLRLSIKHRNGDLLIEDTNHPEGLKREDQFNRFVVACGKVKAGLREVLNNAINNHDLTTLDALGIKEEMREELWNAEDPLEVILESLISGNQGVLGVDVLGKIRQDMAEKDLAQKKISRSSSFKGMAIGAVVPLVGASLGQAIGAGASEHITSFAGGAYEKIRELFGNKGDVPTPQEAPIATNWAMSQNSNIETPAGFQFVISQNGGYNLDGPNGIHIEGLQMQANGALTDESMRLLQEHGIDTTTNFQTATETIPAQTVDTNADTFIEAAANDKVQVYTDVNRNWIDNGTPESDYNERLLGSAHLQPDGIITIDMSQLRVEPDSKLELSFTMTAPTGDKMLVLTPDSDGIVRIRPEDGPIYDSFQKGTGSNMKFSGEWMHATIDRGVDSNGNHNVDVLATDIGARESTFTVDVPTHETQSVSAINTLHYSVATPPTVDQSPVGWTGLSIPITARTRRGLDLPQTESATNITTPTPPPTPQPQRFDFTPRNITPEAAAEPGKVQPQAAPIPAVTIEQEQKATSGAQEATAAAAATQAKEAIETPQPTTENAATFSPTDLAARLGKMRRRPPAPQNPPEEQTPAAETFAAEPAQAFTQEQPEAASAPSEPGMQPAPQKFTAAPSSSASTTTEPITLTAAPNVPPAQTPGQSLVPVTPSTNAEDGTRESERTERIRAAQERIAAYNAQQKLEETAEAFRKERAERAQALIGGPTKPEFSIVTGTPPTGDNKDEVALSLRMIENAIQEVIASNPYLSPSAISATTPTEAWNRLTNLRELVQNKINIDNFTGGIQARYTRIISNANKWWASPAASPENLRFTNPQQQSAYQSGGAFRSGDADVVDKFEQLLRRRGQRR